MDPEAVPGVCDCSMELANEILGPGISVRPVFTNEHKSISQQEPIQLLKFRFLIEWHDSQRALDYQFHWMVRNDFSN